MIFDVKSWCSPETKLLRALVTRVILSFSRRCNGINTTFSRMFYHLERQAWAGKGGVFILKTKCVQGRSQHEAGEAASSSGIWQIFWFFFFWCMWDLLTVSPGRSRLVCFLSLFCLPTSLVSIRISLIHQASVSQFSRPGVRLCQGCFFDCL